METELLPPPALSKKEANGMGVDAVKKLTKRLSGSFPGLADLLEHDPEAGNGKSKLENRLNSTVQSKTFKQRCAACWVSLSLAIGSLIILAVMGRYAFAGRLDKHSHLEGLLEFIPPRSEDDISNYDLGLQQKTSLQQSSIKIVETQDIQNGHVHVVLASSEGEGTMNVVVVLDKLSESMQSYLVLKKEEVCVSAPHVGVPVRAIYTKSTGTMLNPSIRYRSKQQTEITFDSPLHEITLLAPLALEVDYVSRWGPSWKRNRMKLENLEAVCVFAAMQEPGWEDGTPNILREDL